MAERGGHHLNIVPLFHAGALNVFSNAMLFWGGRVTTVGRFEPRTALRLLNDPALAITHLCGVLQMYEWMTALPEFPESAFPALRTVLFGGWGPSAAGIYRAWAARGIWMQLSYGASEIGPNISVLSTPDLGAAERGSSGTILPHTRVRLVDAEDREVATGETGEILVRGPGVVPGYWHQDPAPFFTGGWFRTGDAGRMDEAGHLYIVGRVKEVYRSGGENVYPAEVEQALADMPGIAEFAVLGVPDERWGETGLIAVVPEPGVTITLEAVREYAGPRLARFKLPSQLLVSTELPRSATDKISRPAIREIWQRGRQPSSAAWPCHDKAMCFQRFSARIAADPRGHAVIVIPFDPDDAWGAKAVHHVNGTVNGCRVRVTIAPGDSGWAFTLNPASMRHAGIAAGSEAIVELAPEGPQRGDLADDISAALEANPAAGAFFDTLAQFYRKAYLRYIDATTRRPGLRAARIAEVTGLLADGVKERPRS